MNKLLVDTSGYTAFKRGDKKTVDLIQLAEYIIVSPIVLGELLGGFSYGSQEERNREELSKFINSSRVTIAPLTEDTARFYSQVYVNLRKKGRPIPTNDLWIAAQALEHGALLCTQDKHFREIDGLISGSSAEELFII